MIGRERKKMKRRKIMSLEDENKDKMDGEAEERKGGGEG